jgi:hypothetical protein
MRNGKIDSVITSYHDRVVLEVGHVPTPTFAVMVTMITSVYLLLQSLERARRGVGSVDISYLVFSAFAFFADEGYRGLKTELKHNRRQHYCLLGATRRVGC